MLKIDVENFKWAMATRSRSTYEWRCNGSNWVYINVEGFLARRQSNQVWEWSWNSTVVKEVFEKIINETDDKASKDFTYIDGRKGSSKL